MGILYNIGRFATLTDTGDVQGFEASIAQAIAEDWGVNVQFKQVTRQNAVNMLLGGRVDLLMGEVMLSRDMQALIDYSDPAKTSTAGVAGIGAPVVIGVGGLLVGVVLMVIAWAKYRDFFDRAERRDRIGTPLLIRRDDENPHDSRHL